MAQTSKDDFFFYPNDCFVCNKTTGLKRCGRCQMISYCGEAHQKSDWELHKNFCEVISKLLKKMKVSHIFEKFRGCSIKEWIVARENMGDLISQLMGHNILDREREILCYPRCCFVCYDTRQRNLTNCPNCPLVSFCNEHPRSARHDKMCSEYKQCHYYRCEFNKVKLLIPKTIISIVSGTPMKFSKLPTSMLEYLNTNPTFRFKSNDNLKIYVSSVFSTPLTLFNAIRKLNCSVLPKMTFHVSGFHSNLFIYNCWEVLLHLFSDLTCLTVVLYEHDPVWDSIVTVCTQCSSLGKKLVVKSLSFSLEEHILKDTYETPNLSAILDLKLENALNSPWKRLSRLGSPLVVTTGMEKTAKNLFKHFNSDLWKPLICYQGKNDFGSLWGMRYWEDWEISKLSQFLIVTATPNKSYSVEEKYNNSCPAIPKEIKENQRQIDMKTSKNFFYPSVCHFCKTPDSAVSCKRCKMIFYCGISHMKKDSAEHREICKVILKFLNEKGTPHLYDNLKTADEESWLNAKLNFMKEAKLKLKRELKDFEKQMFLFPKICFVCRESDLSILNTCKCGVSLCKIHRDDSMHKNLCNNFSLNLKLGASKKIPEIPTVAAVPLTRNKKSLPPSLESFMDSYINLKIEDSDPSIQNMIKILVSDFLTRPLTFIYALEKLNIWIPKTMTVHIIGAIDKEIQDEGYWRIVSYWLNDLRSLKIVFIGIEISENQKASFKYPLTFVNSSTENGKSFDLRTIQGRYDQFFKSTAFSKPDMIIGYNLDLDKCNLGIAKSTWKETISAIKTINVPFLLTAKSNERARKDNSFVCSILGKVVKYEFCEKNPYSSLVPERDFKTEKLCYSNYYIIAYKSFTKTKTAQKAISKVSNVNFDSTNNCKKSGELNEYCNNKLEVNNLESKVQTVPKNLDPREKIQVNNDELLKKNLLLQEENKILKENLYLKEENERLKQSILELKENIAVLKVEN